MSNDLYRVYKTVNNMLYNRGYIRKDIDYNLFKKKSHADLTIFTETRPDYKIQKGSIFVFFPSDEKVGVKPIRTYKAEMSSKKCVRAIVVTKDGITPFARSEINSMATEKDTEGNGPFYIEIFTEPELMIDITEHELVPKHEVLTHEEKDLVLKQLCIKEHQLPKIMSFDPVTRYFGLGLGLEKGSVFKITRFSETGGNFTGYRIVV